MPHDCLYLVTCAAVVQTFYAATVGCSKSAMPYHELVEVVGRHLRLKVVPLVAELVGAGLQESVHTLAYLVVGRCPERRCRVVLYLLYHLLVFCHCRSPSVCSVELRTVGTCHVRDVPDGVGARSVLQCGTCQSVGEALHHRLAVAAVGVYTGVLGAGIPCT